MPPAVRPKGTNVFHPLQDPPESEQHEEDDGVVTEDGAEVIDPVQPPPNADDADDEHMLDPALHAIHPIIPLISAPLKTHMHIDTHPLSPIPILNIHTGPLAPIGPLGLQKRKYSALMASGSGSGSASTSTSPSSTPGPSAKRRHIMKREPPEDPESVAISERLDNFTEAFRVATGTSMTGIEASPIRKRRAIRSAQELEDDLSDLDLVNLVNLFRSDVGAADTYMELKREGLRKAWVMDQLHNR